MPEIFFACRPTFPADLFGVGESRIEVESRLRNAFDTPRERYQIELDRIAPAAGCQKNHGNTLSNPGHVITVASRSAAAKPGVMQLGLIGF